jgi:radical SAM protein with 4Fe4S-binding SPASM domain
MFARLHEDWILRGWKGAPRNIVNYKKGIVRALTEKGFYVARSCDGNTDFRSFAFLPEHQVFLDKLIEECIAVPCNPGYKLSSFQEYKAASNPSLKGIHWCITGLCNLNCLHCLMESPSGRFGDLPYESLENFANQFVQANVMQVAISGGEPFLRDDILDIIAFLSEKNLWLREIFSNGLLIQKKHLDAIRQSGFCPSFQISFDGINAHDYMRQAKGIEKTVIQKIEMIRSEGFPVTVSTSLDKKNAAYLMKTYQLFKKLDIQFWRIGAPQKIGNWKNSSTAISLKDEADAYIPLLQKWMEDNQPFEIQMSCFYRSGMYSEKPGEQKPLLEKIQDNEFHEIDVKNNISSFENIYNCNSYREQINLLPDGTLTPCPGFLDEALLRRMPNLLHQDLSDALTQSYLREILDMTKAEVLLHNPECVDCEKFERCGGGCRVSALVETGEMMQKDPILCELWKSGLKQSFEAEREGMEKLRINCF